MLHLKEDWQNQQKAYEAAGIILPQKEAETTLNDVQWLHFGGGNLYRGFHGAVAQDLLDQGKLKNGVVVCETYDEEVIDKAYAPYQEKFLQVVMHEDGTLEKRLLASTAKSFYCHPKRPESFQQVQALFQQPSLQLVTFTITEKGYNLKDSQGQFLNVVKEDLQNGPTSPQHTISIVTALLLARFKAGKLPIAMVSTDNFSHNGKKFQAAVLDVATGWVENKFVPEDFLTYLQDEKIVSFPWSMIDRITPNPAETVLEKLKALGIADAQIIHTTKHTNIAPFANTEEVHYLVVENNFPNGEPGLASGGVILTDRDTVDKADAMKVTTCLNPLHTALAIFGCLLDYQAISAEMKNPHLLALIKEIGYTEGLPVVDNPKIIQPETFIAELLEKRLPNPFIPDTPQRIASDTSQKVAIRYGETLKKYVANPHKDVKTLTFIPLTIAAWLRYLLGVDDKGTSFTPSPDPLLTELQEQLAPITLGCTKDVTPFVAPILKNKTIFGLDLYEIGLGEKIAGYFTEMLVGPFAVAKTLEKYLTEKGAH